MDVIELILSRTMEVGLKEIWTPRVTEPASVMMKMKASLGEPV
jgi:hypothetical protein